MVFSVSKLILSWEGIMSKLLQRTFYSLKLLRGTQLQIMVSSSLVMMMGTIIIYPVLPVIHDSLHIPKAQIGIVISAFTLPAVFIAPLAGFIADLRGRKWIMVISLLLYGLAGLSICLVSSFKWLIFLRSVQGVGYSGVMPLVVVLIGDSFTKEEETAAQGMKVFVDRVGTLCLPPLAGMLGVVAWQAPFVLYGLAIPLAICVLLWVPEPKIIKHNRILPYFKDVFTLIRRLYCLTIFSISSLRHFLQVGFFTYLPIFAIEKLGLSVSKGGFLFSVYAVGAMITSTQLGVLAMRYQRISLVIFAFLIQGICLLTVPAVPGVFWLGVIMFFFGLANGIISPSHKSLLTQSAPVKLRGGVVSADRALQNIGKTVSPLIAGLIMSLRSTEIVFYVLGAIALVWVTSVMVLHAGGYLQRDKSLTPDIAA